MFTTRTAFGIVSALLLTVAGASACSSSAESDTASATRSVTHELGTVEVPASPQRILALDEYAGLSALALGVKPTVVYSTLRSDVAKSILREQGVEVLDKPTFFANPAVEEIASVEPDEILMSNAGPLPSLFAQINAVAPTLVLPYSAPWRDVLEQAGAQLDRGSEATAMIGKLESGLEGVKSAAAGQSLAILLGYSGKANERRTIPARSSRTALSDIQKNRELWLFPPLGAYLPASSTMSSFSFSGICERYFLVLLLVQMHSNTVFFILRSPFFFLVPIFS